MMDQEVRDFKRDIEKKFHLSAHNISYKFPYTEDIEDDDDDE